MFIKVDILKKRQNICTPLQREKGAANFKYEKYFGTEFLMRDIFFGLILKYQ
jgi:hypothetical protein